jgi:hypothetical protein
VNQLPANITFEEWVKHVFDHPVHDHLPAWYWNTDSDFWNAAEAPTLAVSHITRAFEDPIATFAPYSDAQLNQGLWFLISNGCSDQMFALLDETVPLTDRLRAVRAMYNVFEQIFVPRCSPNLSYLDEHDKGEDNPLDSVCYMWWDLLPIGGPTGSPLGEAILDVIERALALDSDAVRESALHGLGHWKHAYPQRVEMIIDRFVKEHPGIRPELASYARAARTGCVL